MKLARMIALPAAVALGLAGCGGGSSPIASTRSTVTSATQTQTTGATATTPAATTPPPSREISPGVVRAAQGEVTATMHASGHHPRVNVPWPVSFTVSHAGKAAMAEVRYEYLFAGQVVARRSHYKFNGSFHDTFQWPSSAVGYPLTLRAVIVSGEVTLNLDYPVRVLR